MVIIILLILIWGVLLLLIAAPMLVNLVLLVSQNWFVIIVRVVAVTCFTAVQGGTPDVGREVFSSAERLGVLHVASLVGCLRPWVVSRGSVDVVKSWVIFYIRRVWWLVGPVMCLWLMLLVLHVLGRESLLLLGICFFDLLDIKPDLFTQQLPQLIWYPMFCSKFSRQIFRVVTFFYQKCFIFSCAYFNSNCKQLVMRIIELLLAAFVIDESSLTCWLIVAKPFGELRCLIRLLHIRRLMIV